MDWTVVATFDSDIDLEAMDMFEDKLEECDGVVSRLPELGQFEVTLHAVGEMMSVFQDLTHHLANLIGFEPVRVEILTDAEHGRRALSPTMPELMSAVDVAAELGVSRQRVHSLRSNPRFPRPLAELGGGAVWDARAIRAFHEQWERKPGRPSADILVAYGAEGETPRLIAVAEAKAVRITHSGNMDTAKGTAAELLKELTKNAEARHSACAHVADESTSPISH